MTQTFLPKIKSVIAISTLCVSLSACALKEYKKQSPVADLPKDWESKSNKSGEYVSVNLSEEFSDPKLKELIDELLKHNRDLQETAANMEKAASQAKKAGADLLPTADLNFKSSRGKNMNPGIPGFTPPILNTYGVSLDVTWEVDVWGRIRAGNKAAAYDYEAAKQSLIAQMAKAYFLVIETEKQLDLARSFQSNLKETLKVTEAFFEEGLISKQDIHLAKADLASASESIKNAESANLNALRSLEILLGRYPTANIDISASFPNMPKAISTGVPSEVLERRPDIRAAERRVAAAFNRLNEAKAAKLPSLSLTNSFGTGSRELRDVTDPANIIWNIAGNIMFPIFSAGRLSANVDIKTAEQKAAIANYQQSALKAFLEVENSISNEALFRERQNYLDEAYKNAKAAETIADENFKAGTIELLNLLQIKRSALTTMGNLIRSQRELLDQRVNLHLSLGGYEYLK